MAEAVTAARGISAPDASVTRPVIVPWSCWAVRWLGHRRRAKRNGVERRSLDMALGLPVAIARDPALIASGIII
jgi:hypothetical protein